MATASKSTRTLAASQAAGPFARQLARFDETGSPAWLRPIRRTALAYFREHGLPTPRDEDWRFTNLAPLAELDYAPVDGPLPRIDRAALAPLLWPGVERTTVVFVNGRLAPELSDLSGLPAGVELRGLAEALREDVPGLREYLAGPATATYNALAALNTALFADGACLRVPPGTVLESPLHLLYVSVPGPAPSAAHARNLIVGGEDSQFQVVEQYAGLAPGVYLNNVVTELVAGPNCRLQHYRLVREADAAFHVATTAIRQERSSAVQAHAVELGGALLRLDFNPLLDGPGADCHLYGLYVLAGAQHADNHLRVEHRSPHGSSRQVFRGILDGRSRGVFSGRIIVRPGAQQTDAKQTSMTLLLSEGAQSNSNPQLEIFADDVKCTHGSTTGQVDEEAVFYLRARGLSADLARNLLIFAFARESLKHVAIAPLRARLEQEVLARLPQGQALQEAL